MQEDHEVKGSTWLHSETQNNNNSNKPAPSSLLIQLCGSPGPSRARGLPASPSSLPCLPRVPLPPLLSTLETRTPLLQAFLIGCCLERIPPSGLDPSLSFWLRPHPNPEHSMNTPFKICPKPAPSGCPAPGPQQVLASVCHTEGTDGGLPILKKWPEQHQAP